MTLHRGKIAREPTITNVRPLTRDDLLLLREARGGRDSAGNNVAKKLRDHHHRIARLVAAGLRNFEIAERTGMSISRISMYRKDPAFNELVDKYRPKVDAAYEREQDEYYNLATANMRKAETMIAEKLEQAEEDGEFLPTRELIAISRDAANRFGYGKRNMNLNVNVDFAAQLEKTIARSKTITIESGPSPPSGTQARAVDDVPAIVEPPATRLRRLS